MAACPPCESATTRSICRTMQIDEQTQGGFQFLGLFLAERRQHLVLVCLCLFDPCRNELLPARGDAHERDAPAGFMPDAFDVALCLHAVEQTRDRGLFRNGNLGEVADADRFPIGKCEQDALIGDLESGGLDDDMEFAGDQLADLSEQRGG